MEMLDVQVVFFRHASRGGPGRDPDLSAQGQQEAKSLGRSVGQPGRLPKPTLLWSSPKKRAQKTFFDIEVATGLRLQIVHDLDEAHDSESVSAFAERVHLCLEKFELLQPNDVLFVCSHSDWLEIAMRILPSDMEEELQTRGYACAEYRNFTYQEGLWIYQK